MKKVKKMIIPGVYLTAVLSVIGCIYLTVSGINNYMSDKDDFKYSINGINSNPIKAVQGEEINNNTKLSISRPYTSDKVKVGRYFYDYKAEASSQEKSIVFYENTYMQNTGIDYISDEVFDVISILPGKVSSIEKDEVLGNIVKISHEKDIITVYEGIDNVALKVGEEVKQNQLIGTSGASNINSNYKTSLHFEVYYKDTIVNPENFYTLDINEL